MLLPSAAPAGADRLLSLAAAPICALMAVLSAGHGDAMPATLCGSVADGSPLTGMAAMYGLMTAFHLAPWLRLVAARRGPAQPSRSAQSSRAATQFE